MLAGELAGAGINGRSSTPSGWRIMRAVGSAIRQPTDFSTGRSSSHPSAARPFPMPFLKRADVDLYYELTGSGTPILFIQGVGVSGEGWRPQVRELACPFQTLLFDNRGIGRSLPCPGPIGIET